MYEAAMHLSEVSGKRLGKVLSDLARRGLQPGPMTAANKGKKRFPTFQVPAGTPKLSVAKIQRAIDEDGLF